MPILPSSSLPQRPSVLLTLQRFSSQSIFFAFCSLVNFFSYNFHIVFWKLPKGPIITEEEKYICAAGSFAPNEDENKTCPAGRPAAFQVLPLAPSSERYFWRLFCCLVSSSGSGWRPYSLAFSRPLLATQEQSNFRSCQLSSPSPSLTSYLPGEVIAECIQGVSKPATGCTRQNSLYLQQTKLSPSLRCPWWQPWPKPKLHHPKSDSARNFGHQGTSHTLQV